MESQNSRGHASLGLIAGWGEFPALVAQVAKQQGSRVIAIGFLGETESRLRKIVDEIHWIGLGQLGKIIKVFKKTGVRQAVMAGLIRHKQLFINYRFDLPTLRILTQLKDKRANSILRAVAQLLEKNDIHLVSPLPWLKPFLPEKGVLTIRRPTVKEQKDIAFGYHIAKHIAAADIGQTVVVKDQAVIAVEAMEGTDACIIRSGKYVKVGAVAVKVTKPSQDLRFDVPVIGPRTIRSMKQGHVQVLAFDSGQTLLLQHDLTLANANQARLSLVAL